MAGGEDPVGALGLRAAGRGARDAAQTQEPLGRPRLPHRWYYVPEHAAWARGWLADLPPEIAERIAWRNGEALFASKK
jgi:hypothetical protein